MKEGWSLYSPASWVKLIFFVLLLPQACKRRETQRFGSLLNIQIFNSFHPDATQPAFCLCSAFHLRSAGPRILIKPPPASLFYFFLHLNEFGMFAWLLTPLNRWTNQHVTEEWRRRRKERKKTVTGESVSISCRWSRDAIQLLRVLLLLLLRKESGREQGRENYRGREREKRSLFWEGFR